VTDRQILKLIGQNVRAIRQDQHLTLECLAELVGVHWHTILNLEQGKFPTPITTFARLSQALGVSPNRLLDGLPEPDMKRMERIKKAKAHKRTKKEKQ
jgi:transcriptional regulator with XRE-family HTH domain